MSNKSIISVSEEENQQWVIITLLPSSRGNFPSSITLSADGEMRTPLYLDIDILENNMAEQVYNYVWLLNHIPQEKGRERNLTKRNMQVNTFFTTLFVEAENWKQPHYTPLEEDGKRCGCTVLNMTKQLENNIELKNIMLGENGKEKNEIY